MLSVSLSDPCGKPWVATIPETNQSATTETLRANYQEQFSSFFDRDPLMRPIFRLSQTKEELKHNDNLCKYRSANSSQLHLYCEIQRSFSDLSTPTLKVRCASLDGKLVGYDNDSVYAVLLPNHKEWTKYNRDDYKNTKNLDKARLNEACNKHHSSDAQRSRLQQKLRYGSKKSGESCISQDMSYTQLNEEPDECRPVPDKEDNNPLADAELIRLFEPAKRSKKKRKQKKEAVVSHREVKSNATTEDTPVSDSGASTASEHSKILKKQDFVTASHTASEDDGEWHQCKSKRNDKERKEKKDSITQPVSNVVNTQSLPGTFSTNARPDLERTKLCRRFAMNQTCTFADNCWFSHDMRLLELEREEERLETDSPVIEAQKKEEPIVAQKPIASLSRAAVKSERPDPPKLLVPTVWGTLAPVSTPAKAHPSSRSPTIVPAISSKSLAPPAISSKSLVPPAIFSKSLVPPAPTISCKPSRPVASAGTSQSARTNASNAVKASTDVSCSPGLQFLQREQCREISFLEQWTLPVNQGIEILAFATDVQKEMAYTHFNPSDDERTIEALRRFLDTCIIDEAEEKREYRVPPTQRPPPPPVQSSYIPTNETHTLQDDQGWDELFHLPFSVFPSKTTSDEVKVELHRKQTVNVVYDGIEVNESGVAEGGYLPLMPEDVVVPTDGDFPGHARNRFESYFFGYLAKGGTSTSGWFPAMVFR